MMINLRLVPFALVLCTLFGAAPALAHSKAVRTNPAANAALQKAPRDVSILFNERIKATPDAIVVEDADGTRVDQSDTQVESNGRVIRVSLRPLSAGTYKVKWRVQSSDTHTVEGSFTFRVRQ